MFVMIYLLLLFGMNDIYLPGVLAVKVVTLFSPLSRTNFIGKL